MDLKERFRRARKKDLWFDDGGGGLPIPQGNLYAWYRKGVGQVNSSGLTSWADQSGNGRHLDSVADTKGTVNGDGTVTWAEDGAISVSTTLTNQTTGTAYIRFRVNSRDATDQRGIMAVGSASGCNMAYRSTGVADAQLLLAGGMAAYPQGASPPNTPDIVGTWYSAAIRINGASSDGGFSNGTLSSAFNTSNFGDVIRLASNHNDTVRGDVTIAEVIFYNTVHSNTTFQQILTYLDGL